MLAQGDGTTHVSAMPPRQTQFARAAQRMPLSRDPVAIRQRVEALEALLEGMFTIPGINRRVGLDSIVGLIPVIGDISTAAMGAYIVWEARNLGVPKWRLAQMAANVGIDTAIGAVPLLGDAFDLFWKSNTKNLRIIRKHLDKHHPSTVTIER